MSKQPAVEAKDRPSITVEAEQIGFPGVTSILVVSPTFAGDNEESERKRLQDSSSRLFKVTARLSRIYSPSDEIDLHFGVEQGESFFQLPMGKQLEVELGPHKFRYLPNAAGRLAIVEFECIANSSSNARKLFHEVAAASLDHLSYAMNVPVTVAQVSVFDTKNSITVSEVVPPYHPANLDRSSAKIYPRLDPVYAMYREGINTNSPFYRFFCFYKILEGLLVTLRSEVYKEARIKGIDLPKFSATVPDFPGIADSIKPHVGQAIHRFYEEVLSGNFRHAVAHFVNNQGAVLHVNQLAEINRYTEVIQVTELCCRSTISHFEACLELLEASSGAVEKS